MTRLPAILPFCAAALLLIAHAAPAAQIDPFTSVVSVPDRSDATRILGFEAALRQTLTKYTGRADLSEAVQVSAVERLVQLFTYLDASKEDQETLRLEVRFQPQAVRDLVRNQRLPAWPLERGSTLAWIVMDNAGERSLLGLSPDDQAWLDFFRDAAQERGLPLIEPLLDLQDQTQISPAAVWGGFVDQVAQASDRYAPDYLLLGRLGSTGDGWSGRWIMDTGSELLTWSALEPSLQSALEEGAKGAAERLARRFAIGAAGESGNLELYVTGLSGPQDYGRVSQYLTGLSIISDLQLRAVDPLGVLFTAQVDGGFRALEQILNLDRQLRPGPSTQANRVTLLMDQR